MIETPLHHCYLVSANDTSSCVLSVKSELEQLLETVQESVHIETDTSETLTIDKARQLRERGQQKSTNEIRCFIHGFDTATVPAQNALLKIIEAPAAGTHFFFVTEAMDSMLETVRSRTWLMTGICTSSKQAKVADRAQKFTKASGLPERLEVMSKVKNKSDVRELVRELSGTELPRKNKQFGEALELVADWSHDTGASVKLLTQFLAIAATQSPEE